MEINPRMTAGMEVAERSGVPFAQLVYDWVRGVPVPAVKRYRIGVKVRWLAGDVRRLRYAASMGDQPDVPTVSSVLSDLVSGHGPRMHYDYVEAGDLAPAFTALRGFIGDVVARKPL